MDDQETKSIIEAKKETASIIDIYQLLMYCDGYCLDNVFNHIPVQLAKENKKFQISKVASGAKFKDYWGCIEWLVDAGMINLCYCLHTPDLPLKGNYEDDKYKVYFRDTGLLVANLDEEAQEDLRANITTGIKLIHGNVGFENNIHTFPYFCAFLLKRYLADVEW